MWLYPIAIRFASLFNQKAKLWIAGRRNIIKKISDSIEKNTEVVWFYCASLGEFEQAKPILKAYKLKYPNHKILLTFFSPSGFEIKQNTDIANWVFYLPSDTRSNAKKLINIIKPIKVIFIKYEFWFNYMAELKRHNIPFYSVSTIFHNDQPFFKYKWWKEQLKNVDHFFIQDKKSAQLLNNIGYDNYTISGDSRFDTVFNNIQNSKKMPLIETFSQNKYTLICGSTWLKDESLLIQYIKAHPQNNYIIAPHEMNNISNLQKNTGGLLYSNCNEENILTSKVLIIDSIGILPNIYQYGNLAYIGGGFNSGIHNILEAVTFGLPVVFGPNYKKFNEAIALINRKGAISISNYKELVLAFDAFNNFEKSIATNYISDNRGATNIIIEKI